MPDGNGVIREAGRHEDREGEPGAHRAVLGVWGLKKLGLGRAGQVPRSLKRLGSGLAGLGR